jgi:hypothetical protein
VQHARNERLRKPVRRARCRSVRQPVRGNIHDSDTSSTAIFGRETVAAAKAALPNYTTDCTLYASRFHILQHWGSFILTFPGSYCSFILTFPGSYCGDRRRHNSWLTDGARECCRMMTAAAACVSFNCPRYLCLSELANPDCDLMYVAALRPHCCARRHAAANAA